MKPQKLLKKKIKKTRINNYQIKMIEIDLQHINYGLNQKKEYETKKRSTFSANEIAQCFQSLDGLELTPEQDDLYDYFAIERSFFDKETKYRMVFCIERKIPTTSGIITFFKVKKGE